MAENILARYFSVLFSKLADKNLKKNFSIKRWVWFRWDSWDKLEYFRGSQHSGSRGFRNIYATSWDLEWGNFFVRSAFSIALYIFLAYFVVFHRKFSLSNILPLLNRLSKPPLQRSSKKRDTRVQLSWWLSIHSVAQIKASSIREKEYRSVAPYTIKRCYVQIRYCSTKFCTADKDTWLTSI